MRSSSFSVFALLLCARVASAQEVRGRVSDVASAAPVSGAVVQLLDSARVVVGRNISNERGEYRVSLTGAALRTKTLKFVRIGFRPLEIPIAASDSGALTVNARMTALPTMLEPVHVLDQPNCPRRDDRPAAFALWEQAQTGLLATLVAREANPGAMVRIGYHRNLDRDGKDVMSQTVRLDSIDRLAAGFVAMRTAAEFVNLGFVDGHDKTRVFYGPDAEAILDDDFLVGYCLRVVGGSNDRPNQVGLGFDAAKHKRDRVDIEGTVWIDTTARALLDIEFKYVGLDGSLERLHPGGHMEFREMPNGAVLLYRWNLRLVGAESNLILTRDGFPYTTSTPYAQDGGGEIARVSWPDGKTWRAPLGTLRLHATKGDGSPAVGAPIGLENTDYRATTDSLGDAEISGVLPGTFPIMIHDRLLAPVSVAINSGVTYTAARDSIETKLIVVPAAEDAVKDQCAERQHVQPGEMPWLLVRVLTPDGQPIPGITLNVRKETPSKDWVRLRDEGTTGGDGLVAFCRALGSTENVVVEARRKSERVDTPVRLKGDLTVVPIIFPKTP